MEWVISSNDKPIKSWCANLEDGAMAQAENLANHPVIFRHVALMSDAHQGFGMPIGGVVACDKAIIPYAVGSDIGCGMAAVRTSYRAEDIIRPQLTKIMEGIRKVIPMGVGIVHEEDQDWEGFDPPISNILTVINRLIPKAKKQLGTLGGGNHFWEMQAGDDGYIWIMLHSGSRKLGYDIADYYYKQAVKLCDKWFSQIPCKELAFFPIDDIHGREYEDAMNYALEYAQANRDLMMVRSMEVIKSVLGCDFGKVINVHHNYARWENHFGKNVIVHRKGATSAKQGETGIIPGSMGTASYIVSGLGNPESFSSCSHGAGRAMGRNAANKALTVADCDKAMEGVVFGSWGEDRKGRTDLSEAPGAYKDIEQVIAAQADLVEPVVRLMPLASMKG